MDKFWRPAAECLIAGVALISLAVLCYRLHLNLATSALLFVIVVVLVSRVGSFVSSVVTATVAALCLDYLVPPANSLRINDPLDVVAIVAFLTTSLIIASLLSRVRKQSADALSSVSDKVIAAEERERQRFAEHLHEDIGQRLSLLAIEIERVKPDSLNTTEAPNRMDVLRGQTLQILTDVKVLAHQLHSPRLAYLGIADVMSSFCEEFADGKMVEINFKSDGLPSVVPPDVTLCLFRVLQEAIYNAVQHSGVRQFDVKLWVTLGEIHLTVSDCGVGFDLETARKAGGLGLNRMQERLKLIKGKLSIDSQPRQGTTVHAVCRPIRELSPSR